MTVHCNKPMGPSEGKTLNVEISKVDTSRVTGLIRELRMRNQTGPSLHILLRIDV